MIEFSLKGKVELVTGGGRGLGQAIALGLARAGADVAVASRTRSQLEETADRIQRVGRKALPVVTDIGCLESVKNMVSGVVKRLG